MDRVSHCNEEAGCPDEEAEADGLASAAADEAVAAAGAEVAAGGGVGVEVRCCKLANVEAACARLIRSATARSFSYSCK